MSTYWPTGCDYKCRDIPKSTIYAHAHFDHCCECAKFRITYKVLSGNKSIYSAVFGSVNVNGCGNIFDTQVGRKKLIPENLNWEEILFTCTCESTGEICTSRFGTYGCHQGMSFELSNETGTVIGDIVLPVTTEPVIFKYCDLFRRTAGAP